MATQGSGQPPDEGGEHGPIGPVQAWSWVGAAEHGDLVPQHEQFDVLGGGRAANQHDKAEDWLCQSEVAPEFSSDLAPRLVSGRVDVLL